MKKQKPSGFATPRERYTEFRTRLLAGLTKDDTFKAYYLAENFESKLLDPEYSDTPEQRKQAAIKKWLTCEDRNRETNVRLMHHNEEDFLFLSGQFPIYITDVLSVARRFVSETIGSSVPYSALKGSFSGGASTSVRRGLGTIARKFLRGTDITEDAIRHFLPLTISEVWAPRDFTIARGNVMFTVPKSTIIDRCAAKEPEYNMYLQKAAGDFIRGRLRRKGIDLNDQTVNQRLARVGSEDGSLATIDLSSASDSITTQLVLLLLPDDWYFFLDDIRSKETCIDGEWHTNEMFSSMGNGFTFELESLIFWALTRACAYLSRMPGRISVYGDDIICPSGLKDAVLATFDFCGFTINPRKSFFEGDFRESCGSHWYRSTDVTPFYVKKVPVDVSDWCHLLNSFRRWCYVSGGICDPTYYTLWKDFADLVPEPVKGHWDLTLRSNLASPGRKPIARLMPKQQRSRQLELEYSAGAYLHWLSVSEFRTEDSVTETSIFTEDGQLLMQRLRRAESKGIIRFSD